MKRGLFVGREIKIDKPYNKNVGSQNPNKEILKNNMEYLINHQTNEYFIEIERLKGHIAELDVISVPNGKNWKTIKISELILKNIRLLIKIGEYILYLLGFDILDADNLTNLKNAKTNFILICHNITDNYFYTQLGLNYERYIDDQLRMIADAAATADVPAPATDDAAAVVPAVVPAAPAAADAQVVPAAAAAAAANGDTDAAVVTAN